MKGYYQHIREGDIIKVEIRDSRYKIIYKNKFNITNKQAILNLLMALEKFSGFSIYNIIKEKLNIGKWF